MLDYLLIKLASRCNLDCSYCYWFRDDSVRNLPATMGDAVTGALLDRLQQHICKHKLQSFTCSFHGGEPLLYGKKRLERLIQGIDAVGDATGCMIRYALTTNGVLVDPTWARLFEQYAVSVAVSIDGPQHIHDSARRTLKGRPSWRDAVNGYLTLCEHGVAPSILAVCNPETDPVEVIRYLADDLGALTLDVLVPDENHDSPNVRPIGGYYRALFDLWFDEYWARGVEVRILLQVVRGLMGLRSTSDQIGLGPTQTVCLNTDGRLEPNDVLRIAGAKEVATAANIFDSNLDAILSDASWLSIQRESLDVVQECRNCSYLRSCGGGHLSQRWSSANRYRNVSVYCDDYKELMGHVARRIAPHVDRLLGKNGSDKSGMQPAHHVLDGLLQGVGIADLVQQAER